MVSLVASSGAATADNDKRTVKPIRVGVILRQVGGLQKSANLNTELEALKERYKLMLPQFKKLEKALKMRHATMLKTQEARVGVANVLAEMAKDTPLAEAAGKPATERSTATAADDDDRQQSSSYANAVDEWSQANQRQCETYKTFAIDYVAQWENTVTTRVNADMATTTQLRRDADHYMVKVEQLEKSIQKQYDDKNKPVPEATTEKLQRNREKLDEANIAYNRAAKNLFLLLEEVVDRSWRDLHPVLLKLLQFDLNMHGQQEQVLCRSIASNVIPNLQDVSREHDISTEPRLASLVDGQPIDLTTRPGGVEELDKSFAATAATPTTTAATSGSSSNLRKSAASEQPQEQATTTTTTQSRFTKPNTSNNNNNNERVSRSASASNGNKAPPPAPSQQTPDSPSKKVLPWQRGGKNKDKQQDAEQPESLSTKEKESSSHNRLWNRNKNNNNNKPEIKRNQEKKATKSAATNRHTSTGVGTSATNNNSIGDDPYANADPGCWLLREMIFNGSAVCVEMGEKEDIKGKSIEDGIDKFKKNPHKYIAMMYQSNMLEWPAANQVYTLIHRKGTVGYEPKGIGPSGHLTLLLFDYQRLPAFKDNVLPKASRDKYTDSVLSKFNGLKLHNTYKPVMPGRGMGCCDMPNLKIIGNVDPSDIAQGSVGNCWLLSGISALAEFDGAVKHLFRKTKNLDQMPLSIKGSNAGNMYTISLWDLKTWKEVDIVVDERLCVDNNGQLLASKPSADGELWVCYLEKAIAAHCGGWDKIVGGQCTHAWALLTGCKEQYTIRKNKETGKFECFAKYNPYDKKWAEHANSPHDGVQSMWRAPWPKVGGGGDEKLALDEEELFQRMCAWDDVNYIVGASTEGVSDKNSTDGLVDNHAYSVLESINDVAGTEIDMMKVRNPWGRGEIENGMFDDDGPGWDRYPQIKKALNPVVADDGIFWVTKQEFFHYYGTIYLSASNMTEFLED